MPGSFWCPVLPRPGGLGLASSWEKLPIEISRAVWPRQRGSPKRMNRRAIEHLLSNHPRSRRLWRRARLPRHSRDSADRAGEPRRRRHTSGDPGRFPDAGRRRRTRGDSLRPRVLTPRNGGGGPRWTVGRPPAGVLDCAQDRRAPFCQSPTLWTTARAPPRRCHARADSIRSLPPSGPCWLRWAAPRARPPRPAAPPPRPRAAARPRHAPAPPAAPRLPPQRTCPTAARAPDKLKIAYNAVTADQTPIWLAQDAGIHLKHGLDVELVSMQSSAQITPALIAGELAIAYSAGAGTVAADLQGADLVMISSFQPWLRFWLYTRPEVQSVAQLRGSRMGVTRFGGGLHLAALISVERAGMDPERDLTMSQLGGNSEIFGALVGNAIDSGWVLAPQAYEAEALGYKRLVDTLEFRIPYTMSGATATLHRRARGRRPSLRPRPRRGAGPVRLRQGTEQARHGEVDEGGEPGLPGAGLPGHLDLDGAHPLHRAGHHSDRARPARPRRSRRPAAPTPRTSSTTAGSARPSRPARAPRNRHTGQEHRHAPEPLSRDRRRRPRHRAAARPSGHLGEGFRRGRPERLWHLYALSAPRRLVSRPRTSTSPGRRDTPDPAIWLSFLDDCGIEQTVLFHGGPRQPD